MVLQAVALFREAGAALRLQPADGRLGPAGNIINGIDLGRRMGTHRLFADYNSFHHAGIGREDG